MSSILATFTLISRLLGLVRNQILSHFFGAGIAADAFVAAFRIPNALRRLFGEGALTPAIVALLTRALKPQEGMSEEEHRKSWQSFITNSFVWLTLILIVITVLGIVFARPLVMFYVSNFDDVPGKLDLAVRLTQYLFPFILFIGWSAFFMGVLNTFRSFARSAAGPSILNLSVIIIVPLCLLVLFPNSENGIYFYCAALLIGGLLQALIQIPDLRRFGAFPKLQFNLFDPRVKELRRLLVPEVFSLGVYQLNIIINSNFASAIPGAVSQLFYADLLLELPVSLIATSVGVAVVPSFSRLITENNRKALGETFSFSLEAVQMLAIPSMFGLIILSRELVSTLYLTGKFTPADMDITARCLVMYAIGLPFFSGLRIILPLFFAQQDTRIPAKTGFVALGVNLVAAYLLSQNLGAHGIALATSISSFANVTILLLISYKRFPDFEWLSILKTFFKMLLAGAAMAAVISLNKFFVPDSVWTTVGIRFDKIALLLLMVFVGAGSYFSFAFLLKIPHSEKIFKRLLARIKPS